MHHALPMACLAPLWDLRVASTWALRSDRIRHDISARTFGNSSMFSTILKKSTCTSEREISRGIGEKTRGKE
eukprot:2584758-Pleurochrysis_carterae.AAC.1